jgi:hypothetical protein
MAEAIGRHMIEANFDNQFRAQWLSLAATFVLQRQGPPGAFPRKFS